MKNEYNLCNEIDNALDLMCLLIMPFNIKMKGEKIDEGRIREEKTADPIFKSFRKYNVECCSELCVSLSSVWLHAINPNLKFELVRQGSDVSLLHQRCC